MAHKLVVRQNGLIMEFASLADVGQHFTLLANNELVTTVRSMTQKERRYHEGQSRAFQVAAQLLFNMTIHEMPK